MDQLNVDEWLREILSRDAMTFEDAYWGERPSSELAVPLLLAALNVYFDSYTRGKLLELLGECEDISVLPVLEKELSNSEEAIRNWAAGSIEALKRHEPWQRFPK
jgi:hypothetical protein